MTIGGCAGNAIICSGGVVMVLGGRAGGAGATGMALTTATGAGACGGEGGRSGCGSIFTVSNGFLGASRVSARIVGGL
jgi:hypothetical protein